MSHTAAVPADDSEHVLAPGPQKELDIWPVFEVLADLLIYQGGFASVQLSMIGPDVPEGMHERSQLLGASLRCELAHERCSHELTATQERAGHLDAVPLSQLQKASVMTRPGSQSHVHAGEGCLRLTFCRDLYHLTVKQEGYQAPDLIFAPNAGNSCKSSYCGT